METAKQVWSEMNSIIPKFAAEAHKLFVHNEWKWAQSDAFRVPTEQEIHSLAYSLAWECYRELEKHPERTSSCVGSGRLQARIIRYDASGWVGRIELIPVVCCV
ncbi:MAG: hypothetical protein Q8O94_03925 [bacterium]|nr:hypothetical protein [bacterium]MDP2676465.1 hypothetical protein [bacterium]